MEFNLPHIPRIAWTIPQVTLPTYSGILGFLVSSFQAWINIMITSLLHPAIIWLTLPIYFSWFITEWFGEKEETSYGNAASNSIITSYVALDWLRQMYYGEITFTYWKFALALAFLIYGLFVVKEAIEENPVAKYLGAIRTVSYFQIVLTVLFYSEFTGIGFSLESLFGILIGYPIVYGISRIIDKLLPEVVEE